MAGDAFDRAAPTPDRRREAEERRLELERGIQQAKTRRRAWTAIGLALAAIALGWWFRFDIEVASGEYSRAFVVDRLKGGFLIIRSNGDLQVVEWPK